MVIGIICFTQKSGIKKKILYGQPYPMPKVCLLLFLTR